MAGSLRGYGARWLQTALTTIADGKCWAAITERSIVTVDVQHGRVDRAMKQLKKKVMEEGFRETWQAQSVYSKPSQVRKLAAVETKKRLASRVFKEKLRWIMRRKARGF